MLLLEDQLDLTQRASATSFSLLLLSAKAPLIKKDTTTTPTTT